MTKPRKTVPAVLPDKLVADILMAIPAKAPPAKRAAAMKRDLMSRVAVQVNERAAIEAAADGMRIVRANEGRWINFADSVAMKVLHDDGETRTWLARFQPGGKIPAHMQSGDEEAIILEGWCTVGGITFRKGDYQLVPKGSRHGEIISPEGCLIFVRSHSEKRNPAELTAAR